MSSIHLRRCTADRKNGRTMYDAVVEEALALGDTNLCEHEIDRTFFRTKPDYKGNPFNDVTSRSHRMVLALRCPTAAPEALRTMFRNGVAVCDSIRAADEKVEESKGQRCYSGFFEADWDIVEPITVQ
ncbi:hypothetical protein B0H13DRAFT_1890305 [Mycena leptocephala]|nr:hypothetical protein B0H13DRAFT_1890305 [Mycena leptocephala]